MERSNYILMLQSLLEEKSNLIYNIDRLKSQQGSYEIRLEQVNSAILELKRKKDEYIGNRESNY